VPAGDYNIPNDEYSNIEAEFLHVVISYFEGADELCSGISIPDELQEEGYMEGLGEECQVSIRLPCLERLFTRAARSFPDSVFVLFAPNPFSASSLMREPTPFSSTEEDELSSTTTEWVHPPSPPCPDALDLPLQNFDTLQMEPTDARTAIDNDTPDNMTAEMLYNDSLIDKISTDIKPVVTIDPLDLQAMPSQVTLSDKDTSPSIQPLPNSPGYPAIGITYDTL